MLSTVVTGVCDVQPGQKEEATLLFKAGLGTQRNGLDEPEGKSALRAHGCFSWARHQGWRQIVICGHCIADQRSSTGRNFTHQRSLAADGHGRASSPGSATLRS